jgi:hypothetical protein
MISERTRDCLAIILCEVAVAALLRPFPNTPFLDDWAYGWSVQELLDQGQLRVVEDTCNVNLVQILWGALFCLPFGFSYMALRISTWVLAISSLSALYLLLRELEVPRSSALLGAATWGVYPIFFLLSVTFMTDVPCAVWLIWTCLAMVRAVRRRHDGWLWAAALFTCAGLGTRTVGVVVPVAMLLTLVLHSGEWGRQRGRFLIPLLTLAFLGLILWWYQGHLMHSADMTHIDESPQDRLQRLLESGLTPLPTMLIAALGFSTAAVGVALLPLALAGLRQDLLPRAGIVLGLLIGVYAIGYLSKETICAPLTPGQTWAVDELGATRSQVNGYQPTEIPKGLRFFFLEVGAGSFAVLAGSRLRRSWRPGEAFLAWLIVGHVLLIAILWLFYDRYALVLVPLVLVLVLAGGLAPRLAVGLPLVGIYGVLSVVGVRDHLQYNVALWTAVDELHALGAADSEIDGGYMVNGWLQYDHPENAYHDAKGEVVIPWFNAYSEKLRLRYQVTNQPEEGEIVLKRIPYECWLSSSGAIYITDRKTTTYDTRPDAEDERDKDGD